MSEGSQDMVATFAQARQLGGSAVPLVAELDPDIGFLAQLWRTFGPLDQFEAVLQVRPAQEFELVGRSNSI